ncbi:STAS domain-containing protein [Streptomyces sp. NPDC046385]|uniref:STAS domain-containing protein n=1 Tax=unclassified Streptomyces TaxID=2593676 RepID=UPI0033CB1FFF
MAPTDREEHAERAETGARLSVRTRPEPRAGTVVLAVHGELDHDTAAPLRDALAEADGSSRVVVDCSGLRFCDSTGLNVLLRARLRLTEDGGRLDLAGLRPPVDRMFEITGAHTVFQVYEDTAAALADEGGADGRPGA